VPNDRGKADDHRIPEALLSLVMELPAVVVGIVKDEGNVSSFFQHVSRGEDRAILRLIKWPRVHVFRRSLQISHARRAGEPSRLNDWAILSGNIINELGEIKGVAAVATGSTLSSCYDCEAHQV
jgi:hypothetical protein